jgi:hypothetical protein
MEKKKQNIVKKKTGVNPAIASMIQRQNIIESSKKIENEIKSIGNNIIAPEGEKNEVPKTNDNLNEAPKNINLKGDIEKENHKNIIDHVQQEKKPGEEIAESDYERFFRVNDKYEGEKDASVYVYSSLHYKLKNLVNAENRKNINMTVLLSNIVEDFFNKNDKKIKKALKKLSDL